MKYSVRLTFFTFSFLALICFLTDSSRFVSAISDSPTKTASAPENQTDDSLKPNNPAELLASGTAFEQEAKLLASDGAAQDNFSFSVAISGDTAVVGAPRNSGGTGLQSRGSAYVYVRSGNAWIEQQKLAPSDGATTDQFGYAVAISGNTIAVGRNNTTTGQNRSDGKVYIFTRTGSVWSETQTLVSNDIAQGDSFGYALAFEGDTLAVGARNKTNGATLFQGAAYIFTRPSGGGGSFTQQAKLLASDGGFADFFGESVALSGDTAIIGSVNDFGTANADGKAYVFVRSGSDWTQQQVLQAQGGSPNGAFGVSVSVSGDYALIGANTEPIGSGGELGAAYVFVRNGSVWTQQQKFTAEETTPRNDRFGYAVTIKGDTLAIGSPAHEFVSNIANHGAVYVYNRSGAAWTRTQKLLHDDPAPDALGQSLAFDGTSLLAGAPSKNSARGAAYVFKGLSSAGQSRLISSVDIFNGTGYGDSVAVSNDTALVGSMNWGRLLYARSGDNWQFVRKLNVAGGSNTHTWFSNGGAAIASDEMFVGAPGAVVGGVNAAGAVYIFNRAGGNWVEGQRIDTPEDARLQSFGNTIAVSGDTLAVGTPNKTVGANQNQGAVYVFARTGSTWTFQQKLTASDGAAQDSFGQALTISGDTIIVGSPSADVNGEINRGAAYVFTRSGSTWTQQPKLLSSDGNANDSFGFSIALENDTAVISAPFKEVGQNFTAGVAYVFSRSGNAWSEGQRLSETGGNSDISGQFARSVALSGDQLVIGQPNFVDQPADLFNHGAVHIYQRSGSIWTKRGRITAFDPESSAQVGESVHISGNHIIAGAPGKDFYGLTNVGAAYIFDLNQISFSSPGSDFDGDGKTDLSVFRPSEGNWYLNRSTDGFAAIRFGLSTDQLTPADFDGDGRTDIAVWRETEGNFYILNSSDNSVRVENFGLAGDIPSVGDWDGDGLADPAVYRAGAQSYFYYRGSLNNPNGSITFLNWGTSGDAPAPGDFDGDGKSDAAVFRPSNGVWYIRNSSDSAAQFVNWGISGDKLVPADYDGDGKTDPAVYRSGVWYILQSSNNQPSYASFGLANDQPVPADYDGDGKADIAVYRAGVWYVLSSTSGNVSISNFGLNGDRAIPGAFVR